MPKRRKKKSTKKRDSDFMWVIVLVFVLTIFNLTIFLPKIYGKLQDNRAIAEEIRAAISEPREELGEEPVEVIIPEGIIEEIAVPEPEIVEPEPEPDPVCDAENLDLCLDDSSCSGAGGYWYDSDCNSDPEPEPAINKVTIASWNLDDFGTTKAEDDDIMDIYADTIDNYDIVFVQEIINKDQDAFEDLCDLLEDYQCRNSTRGGRDSNEQYGVFYAEDIEIIGWEDFDPDDDDRWNRPPLKVNFKIGDYELIAYNINVGLSQVEKELSHLENLTRDTGNVIVLGNLHADCDLYDTTEDIFEDWNWIIDNNEDTTSTDEDCAYDRILMNNESHEDLEDEGVHTEDITLEVSDHYLVWAELEF